MTSPYTVVKICQILYSKRCVDESVLDEVESVEDKMIALMGAIEKAVSDDHRKLYELAIVLYQIDETASVAEMIIRDYSEFSIIIDSQSKLFIHNKLCIIYMYNAVSLLQYMANSFIS
jgi:hypothetical protein